MNKFDEVAKIADIHAQRINMAMNHTRHLFPFSAIKVKTMSEEDVAWVDLLINRFGKLQDLIGSKLIDLFFEMQTESLESLTLLDKIHKLEKIGIIEDTELWKEMRNTRNHIAHEYPDQPELMAKYLDKIFELVPHLLAVLENIKRKRSAPSK